MLRPQLNASAQRTLQSPPNSMCCVRSRPHSDCMVGIRSLSVMTAGRPQTLRGRRRTLQATAAAAASSESTSSVGSMVSTADIDYFATDARPVILFDGVCNLCNGGVNIMLDLDTRGAFRFAALQSSPGRALLARCGREPTDISSIVLVEPGGCFIKSDAVLRIAAGLDAPLQLLAWLGELTPRGLRDPLYDAVADNRYSFFGRTPSCRVSDPRFTERFLGE